MLHMLHMPLTTWFLKVTARNALISQPKTVNLIIYLRHCEKRSPGL